MASFAEVLNKRADEISEPKPLPPGTYVGIVDGPFQEVTSEQKGTPGAQFTIRLVQPIQVADEAALMEAGGCANRTVRYTFYVTENSEFMLKRFLVDHLAIEPEGKTIGQMLSEAPGRQVAVQLRQTMTKGADPRIIHVVDSFAKL